MRRTKEKKGIKAQRAKSPNTTRAVDALIGDEEQKVYQKKIRKRKKQGAGAQPIFSSPFGRLLRPTWMIQRAYHEIPQPKKEYILFAVLPPF